MCVRACVCVHVYIFVSLTHLPFPSPPPPAWCRRWLARRVNIYRSILIYIDLDIGWSRLILCLYVYIWPSPPPFRSDPLPFLPSSSGMMQKMASSLGLCIYTYHESRSPYIQVYIDVYIYIRTHTPRTHLLIMHIYIYTYIYIYVYIYTFIYIHIRI